jgi:hypothetical protein
MPFDAGKTPITQISEKMRVNRFPEAVMLVGLGVYMLRPRWSQQRKALDK